MRLIGPNCFGVIDVGSGLNASLGMGFPSRGGVSLITQSGAYAMAAFTRSQEGDLGIRRIIAPGNKADVDEVDALTWLVADPQTRVIAMLLESIGNGERLVRAIGSTEKPVVVLKNARSPAAQRAAVSHSAALANDAAVAAAALKQAGAHWVNDGLALLDTAAGLDLQPPLRGPRVAILTNSGGTGVELTDLLEAEGLQVPALSDALRTRLHPILPPAGSTENPIDLTTDWPRFETMYGETLHILLRSDEIDAVVVVLLQRSALSEAVAERVLAEYRAAQASGAPKPVHVCWVAPREAEPIRARWVEGGIPCHRWPLRAARAVAASLERKPTARTPLVSTPAIERPSTTDAHGWFETTTLFADLVEAGLPVAAYDVADAASDAAECAERIGFPVVIKAIRPGLLHRSRMGGVKLNLTDAGAVASAFAELADRLGPGPVLVQEQQERGTEIMIGAKRDPSFGIALLVGLGGVWVEALNDVAIRLPPVSISEVLAMLNELVGQPVLDGLGGKPVDRVALAELVVAVSGWLACRPWVSELDLNPVIANASRAVIVDARLRADPVAEERSRCTVVDS